MIDRKEKLKRLKRRLLQYYMDTSVEIYTENDIKIFNALADDLKGGKNA